MLRAGIGQRRRVVRRHMFKRRKSVQRFVFVCLLSLALLKVHSPMRTVWSKERKGRPFPRMIEARTSGCQDKHSCTYVMN